MNTLEKIVEEIENMKNDAYETLKEEKKKTRSKQNSGELRELSFWIDLCSRYCGEVCR
jgi:hypothetical protein